MLYYYAVVKYTELPLCLKARGNHFQQGVKVKSQVLSCNNNLHSFSLHPLKWWSLPLLWRLSDISAICNFWPQLQILEEGSASPGLPEPLSENLNKSGNLKVVGRKPGRKQRCWDNGICLFWEILDFPAIINAIILPPCRRITVYRHSLSE